jgi:lipopolysaccharide export system permease protein
MIEIYKKYSIPAAAFAFVLIGAPLGILSRKGGMGIAVSISLLIFTFYWACLIGGEDLSDRGLISPFWGMWTANILISAGGLYLLIKVITEKPLFSFFRK